MAVVPTRWMKNIRIEEKIYLRVVYLQSEDNRTHNVEDKEEGRFGVMVNGRFGRGEKAFE